MNRSDVTLIIAKPSYEEMLEIFKKKSETNSEYQYAYDLVTKDVDKKIEDEHFVSLFWTYIKWSHTFSDVSKLLGYLEDLDTAIDLDSEKEITEEIVQKYGWELLVVNDYQTVDFNCYDKEEGSEGNVFGMPSLSSDMKIYNELEEEQKDEDIIIYTVSAFHVYMDNKFEVFNEVLSTTTSELKAKIKLRQEYDKLVASFIEEDYRFNELKLEEENALIQLVNDDRIELSITKTTLIK